MKKIGSVLFFFVIASPASSEEILFSEVVSSEGDGEVLVEVVADDVLVFDGGVYDFSGRQVTIVAEQLRVVAPTLLMSFGPLDVPAAIGGQAGSGSNAGGQSSQTGGAGGTGANGTNGGWANDILIFAGAVEGTSQLFVFANGQAGGQGQLGGVGGRGGAGRNGANRGGNAFCGDQNGRLDGDRGGTGGAGGAGGRGGVGGQGGDVLVGGELRQSFSVIGAAEALTIIQAFGAGEPPEGSYSDALIASSFGGAGGPGGSGGRGGTGGPGGGGGGGSHCGGGGRPGPGGANGPGGSAGSVGQAGSAGEVVLVGRNLLPVQ